MANYFARHASFRQLLAVGCRKLRAVVVYLRVDKQTNWQLQVLQEVQQSPCTYPARRDTDVLEMMHGANTTAGALCNNA